MAICQDECEYSCQTSCEISNQCNRCESFCQNCETCQTACESCEGTCEGSCLDSCLYYCQDCESACESCETCQSSQSPADNAVLTISNITTNSCLASITGLRTDVSYVIKLDWLANNVYKNSTFTTGSSSSYTITGLSSGTQYSIRVEIFNDDTREFLDYLQKNITTLSLPKLPMPTLDTTKTVKTGTSISVTINIVTGATNYYARINGGSQNLLSGRTITFTGLTPNTQYLIEIKVGGTGYEDSDWAGYIATTLIASNWEWTTTERNALNNNGLTTVITYLRWNAFVDKIYEASANDWRISATDGANLSYASTKMTSSDKTLTANRFNSVRYNIGSRISTGIGRVYKDDDVLGSYFLTLETKLNQWIAGT